MAMCGFVRPESTHCAGTQWLLLLPFGTIFGCGDLFAHFWQKVEKATLICLDIRNWWNFALSNLILFEKFRNLVYRVIVAKKRNSPLKNCFQTSGNISNMIFKIYVNLPILKHQWILDKLIRELFLSKYSHFVKTKSKSFQEISNSNIKSSLKFLRFVIFKNFPLLE